MHLVSNSLKSVSWKDRQALVADLKTIYRAHRAEEAELALTAFAEKWDTKYPRISASWLNHWDRIIPFSGYSQGDLHDQGD